MLKSVLTFQHGGCFMTSPDIQTHTKKVSIQERSVLVGDIIVVSGHRVNKALLKGRFTEGGYHIQQTEHFLLFTRSEHPSTILVHTFAPEEINADIKHYIMQELKPLGILTQSQQYGEILVGIVTTFFPDDIRRSWTYYGANTLQRFLTFLSTVSTPPPPPYTNMGGFVVQYQRVCELCTGATFLDAGCESGFLPLLIAERMPFMERVVGVDIRPDMFVVVKELAQERHFTNVRFVKHDLLDANFSEIGTFDTVVALNVVEHFTEKDMYRLIANLLHVTSQRLILTVPYEQEAEDLYEHKQIFTKVKLEQVGQWCLQHLNGAGKMWCEDCAGGLLLIERR